MEPNRFNVQVIARPDVNVHDVRIKFSQWVRKRAKEKKPSFPSSTSHIEVQGEKITITGITKMSFEEIKSTEASAALYMQESYSLPF